jgi:hypothetical protein
LPIGLTLLVERGRRLYQFDAKLLWYSFLSSRKAAEQERGPRAKRKAE